MIIISNLANAITLRDIQKNPQTKYQIINILNKYKKNDLKKEIKEFIYQTRPNRMVGTKGHLKAQGHILKRIKEIDDEGKNLLIVDEFIPDIKHAIKFYQDDFKKQIEGHYKKESATYKKWKNFTNEMEKKLKEFKSVKGKNIIWEKKGSIHPNELLIVSANYDTISLDKKTFIISKEIQQPGADNNATGVTLALALIEILSEVNIERSVRVVFFDFEEVGFLGSHSFVKKYAKELDEKLKFYGLVNLIALGHDTKRKDTEKRFGNMRAYIRPSNRSGSSYDLLMARELTSFGENFSSRNKFQIIPNGMNSSSHINFWKRNLRAVTFSENWENDPNITRHHTSNDFLETLNMKTLFQNFRYISGMILSWTQKD